MFLSVVLNSSMISAHNYLDSSSNFSASYLCKKETYAVQSLGIAL